MALFFAGQIVTDGELNSGSAQVDTTTFTGTPVALTQFSKLWDIPAGSSGAGSSWRLNVLGKSVLGTTAVGQNFFIGFGPAGGTQVQIVDMAGGDQPASSTWWFIIVIHLVINAGGTSGNASVFGTASGAAVGGTSNLTWTNGSVAASYNPTVSNKLQFLFTYQAATGTPVFTSYASVFERMS